MTNNALGAAVLTAAALAIPAAAFARAAAPLVPTALVEEVKSASAGIEFMDYVGPGDVIKLEPSDLLVLSYLKSCEHETITGGTVRVGREQSEVEGGKVVRSKVPCNGNMKRSRQQANASGASAYRLQNAHFEPTIYALPPVIEIPKLRSGDSRTLVIARTKRPGERVTVEIGDALSAGGFYDLANSGARLRPGALYTATLGSRTTTFKVDAKAKTADKAGKTPIVSRLLRFPPG
jgi:hypothetical protein